MADVLPAAVEELPHASEVPDQPYDYHPEGQAPGADTASPRRKQQTQTT